MSKAKQSPLFVVPDGEDHSLQLPMPKPTRPTPPPRPAATVAQVAPSPMPDAPCFACGRQWWWLLSDGSAWRCNICHPMLAVADLHWRLRHHPLRFAVASHHWRAMPDWLADPHAYTIMAWPPKGWPANRNLSLLAPTADILNAYRAHDITATQYTEQFNDLMHERLPRIIELLSGMVVRHVTLLCACPGHSLDERFCHRYLVAKLLTWLGCSEEPYVATQRQERQVAA